MMEVLKGFNHCISKRIVGEMARKVRVEGWDFPPSEEALEAVEMWPMKDYVRRSQSTIE